MKRSKFLAIGLVVGLMSLSSMSIFANNTTDTNNEFSNLDNYIEVSERVYQTQKTLKYVGNYDGPINGVLDNKTEKSLMSFQATNQLPTTGKLTTTTIEKINSLQSKVEALEDDEFQQRIKEEKEREEEELKEKEKQEEIERQKNSAKSVDWFKEGQYLIPRQSIFTVTDVKTGKSFNVKRFGGSSHSDAEPLTLKDTQTMKSIYGNWSWDRRSIIVTAPNGKRIAASMNGMPHAGSSISSNGFNGHFCIHMTNSKTHGGGKLDPNHKKAIEYAIGK